MHMLMVPLRGDVPWKVGVILWRNLNFHNLKAFNISGAEAVGSNEATESYCRMRRRIIKNEDKTWGDSNIERVN